ncbi:AsnC family protein, partial [Candidatus Woesearchaeota archaeon]|nr:AsnC family protein [Candidatus Woesearchaeota archaeon]
MRVLTHKNPELILDTKDWRILQELILNVRQPISQIAKKCLLSRQSVEYRLF